MYKYEIKSIAFKSYLNTFKQPFLKYSRAWAWAPEGRQQTDVKNSLRVFLFLCLRKEKKMDRNRFRNKSVLIPFHNLHFFFLLMWKILFIFSSRFVSFGGAEYQPFSWIKRESLTFSKLSQELEINKVFNIRIIYT